MITKVVAIFDKKTKCFTPPYHSKTKGEALRSFMEIVKNPQTLINKYPEDYTLYLLGEFDDNLGQFYQNTVIEVGKNKKETVVSKNEPLIEAIECVTKKINNES